MGRRSDHSRDELYGMALDATEKLVRENGFAGLTARKVAAEIGYAAGTLYNIFRNQDDLIIHMNARTLERLDGVLRSVKISGAPGEDASRLGQAYVGFIRENAELWHVLFEHRAAEGTELPDWYLARIDRMMGIVEQALSPLFAADRQQDLRDAARLLWSAIHGVCSLASSDKLGVVTTVPLDEAVQRLIGLLLAGMQQGQE